MITFLYSVGVVVCGLIVAYIIISGFLMVIDAYMSGIEHDQTLIELKERLEQMYDDLDNVHHRVIKLEGKDEKNEWL